MPKSPESGAPLSVGTLVALCSACLLKLGAAANAKT